MSKITIEDKKVMTQKFRVSFPNVFVPKSFEDQDAKYNITMLFDKKADLADMKRAVKNAVIEEYGSWDARPKKFKLPFRDGDAEKPDMAGYPGHYFVSATAKADKKPGIVDKNRVAIIDPSEFYAGCYARATLIAFAFDKKGNAGVAFALQNVQKLGDGEKFSGKKSAEDEFDAVESSENDPNSYDDGGDKDDMGF